MSNKNQHITKKNSPKISVNWPVSKENVWLNMQPKLNKPLANKAKTIPFYRHAVWKYSIAASLLVFIGLTAFVRFYTKSVYSPAGQHRIAQLPDGSTAKLNAQSKLTYRPYWWPISREVHFQGEAFFKVTKGQKFTVTSSIGTTTVLGTTFNIFARKNNYKVSCLSGEVEVKHNTSDQKVVLEAGKKVIFEQKNTTPKITPALQAEDTAWIDNRFAFTAENLNAVLNEIERQYAVKINRPQKLDKEYTGNFIKTASVEKTLDLVCKPMGLYYKKTGNNEYQIWINR